MAMPPRTSERMWCSCAPRTILSLRAPPCVRICLWLRFRLASCSSPCQGTEGSRRCAGRIRVGGPIRMPELRAASRAGSRDRPGAGCLNEGRSRVFIGGVSACFGGVSSGTRSGDGVLAGSTDRDVRRISGRRARSDWLAPRIAPYHGRFIGKRALRDDPGDLFRGRSANRRGVSDPGDRSLRAGGLPRWHLAFRHLPRHTA